MSISRNLSFLASTLGSTGAAINTQEIVTVSNTASTGSINFDILTQSIMHYTANATSNWTLNIRGSSSNTFNSVVSANQSLTIAFLATQGATAYYANVISIDSTTVTPKWAGGTAPTGGNANSTDVYSLTIVKSANANTYIVLATQTKFA